MIISNEWLPGLRTLLAQVDALEAERAAAEALVTPAQAAATRLDGQIATIDAELSALSSHRIPTNEERIAALVSGADVPQLPAAEIEAQAQRTRILDGQRRQLAHDVTAIKAHAAMLTGQVASTTTKLRQARSAFALALGDAVLHAYKAEAIAFVAGTMPTLLSVSEYVRFTTGDRPDWADRVLGGVVIRWSGDETAEPDPLNHGSFKRELVNVWPRPDGRLVSGEPVIDPATVHQLIADVHREAAASTDAVAEHQPGEG